VQSLAVLNPNVKILVVTNDMVMWSPFPKNVIVLPLKYGKMLLQQHVQTEELWEFWALESPVGLSLQIPNEKLAWLLSGVKDKVKHVYAPKDNGLMHLYGLLEVTRPWEDFMDYDLYFTLLSDARAFDEGLMPPAGFLDGGIARYELIHLFLEKYERVFQGRDACDIYGYYVPRSDGDAQFWMQGEIDACPIVRCKLNFPRIVGESFVAWADRMERGAECSSLESLCRALAWPQPSHSYVDLDIEWPALEILGYDKQDGVPKPLKMDHPVQMDPWLAMRMTGMPMTPFVSCRGSTFVWNLIRAMNELYCISIGTVYQLAKEDEDTLWFSQSRDGSRWADGLASSSRYSHCFRDKGFAMLDRQVINRLWLSNMVDNINFDEICRRGILDDMQSVINCHNNDDDFRLYRDGVRENYRRWEDTLDDDDDGDDGVVPA